MTPLSPSRKIAAGLAALYGLIAVVGGVLGYVKADSLPSLIAGGASGVLLLLCAAGTFVKPAWALAGAAVVSIALLARFLPPLLNETATSWVPLVMTAGGVIVLLASTCALGWKTGGS